MTKGMAWVRILVGAVWLNGALEKLLNPHFPQQFAQSLKVGGFISQAPSFFRAFMEGVVAPNPEAFAQIVRFVELSLGIALLLGLLTNLAALGSIAQSLVIMLSQGGVAFGTGLGAPEFLIDGSNVLLSLPMEDESPSWVSRDGCRLYFTKYSPERGFSTQMVERSH